MGGTLVDVVPLPPRLANLLTHARPTQGFRSATAEARRRITDVIAGLDAGSAEYRELTGALDALDRATAPPRAFELRNADGADDTAAELMIYSEIGGGESGYGLTAAAFAEQLATVTAKNLTVRLNSGGGSVWDGLAIANLLRSHQARVKVMVDGIAASIASVIMLAGDEIEIGRQAQVMVHDAIGLTLGNPADHREMADLLDQQSDNIAAAYRDRAGGRIDTWRNRMRAESWFSAEEAVAVGLADRVAARPAKKSGETEPAAPGMEPEPDEEEKEDGGKKAPMPAAAQWDLSIFRYAGREHAPDPMADPAQAATAAPAAAAAPDLAAIRAAVRDGLADVTTPIRDDILATIRDAVTSTAAGSIVATAVGPHETAVEEGTWDAAAQEKRLPSPMPVATAKLVYAWYDGARVEDGKIAKAVCKLPHHFVGQDGTPGAASVAGVRAALARLDQTDGPTDADKAVIRRHLYGHLNARDDAEDRGGWAEATRHLTTTTPAGGWADATAHLITGGV
jgi:ATP-dependent protease ClpP protease subunit